MISPPSMSPPEMEKRIKEKEPLLTLTSLPEDLLFNCFARVSRLYYPTTLSLVSKGFQSLLASPELYKVRSIMGRTESCLYVCIDSPSTKSPSWFTLCRKPDQTLTNDTNESRDKNSSRYVLAKVSIPDSPPTNASGLVAVGSSIYNIRSSVSILDCASHTWRKSTSFPRELWQYSASVLDEKIFVAGCYVGDENNGSFKNSFQVLDTKTQVWDHVPFPCSHEIKKFLHKSACIDGKFYLKKKGRDIAYDPKEGRWDMVKGRMGKYMNSEDTYCVIDNVLYSASHGLLRWYDTKVRKWHFLKGSVVFSKFPPRAFVTRVKLANYGGKMVILWDKTSSCCTKTMIWCAVVELEKRCESCEIWGKVEWVDHVLTVPNSCYIVKVLAATV